MKLYDGLRKFVESSSHANAQSTKPVEQPLIHEFEAALRENGYILHKTIDDEGSTNLAYMIFNEGTRTGVMMVEVDDDSVLAYVRYPLDLNGIPKDLTDQIVREIQEQVITDMGHVIYVPESESINYLHEFCRIHFYPYEDLGAQLISLFEQEVELALNAFKEVAKKYGP